MLSGEKRWRKSTRTAAMPSRQPIFLPAARERGVKVTGSSTIRCPAFSSRAVISGSMSKRSAVSPRPRATVVRMIL